MKENIRWFERYVTKAEMSLEGQSYTKEEINKIKTILDRFQQRVTLLLDFYEEKQNCHT